MKAPAQVQNSDRRWVRLLWFWLALIVFIGAGMAGYGVNKGMLSQFAFATGSACFALAGIHRSTKPRAQKFWMGLAWFGLCTSAVLLFQFMRQGR